MLLPTRLRAADVPRLVWSRWFAAVAAFLAAVAGTAWLMDRLRPGTSLIPIVGFLPAPVIAALNRAAATTVRAAGVPARPPVRIAAPARPVPMIVARSVRLRMVFWLALCTAITTICVQNVWEYHLRGTLDLVVDAGLITIPLVIAEVIRRTIRSQAAVTGDPAPLAVQVVGFTHPFARAPVLEPVGGGPRLAVKVAWKWRPDLAVGDVLAWVGPWRSDEDGRHVFPTKVPLAVLACPRRDYLVLTAPEFPDAHPQQRKRRTPRTPGATSGPDG